MPLYAYECPDCGKVEEHLLKLSEREDPVFCEQDGSKMTPILSCIARDRKGAGLYSIDTANVEKWGDYDG